MGAQSGCCGHDLKTLKKNVGQVPGQQIPFHFSGFIDREWFFDSANFHISGKICTFSKTCVNPGDVPLKTKQTQVWQPCSITRHHVRPIHLTHRPRLRSRLRRAPEAAASIRRGFLSSSSLFFAAPPHHNGANDDGHHANSRRCHSLHGRFRCRWPADVEARQVS